MWQFTTLICLNFQIDIQSTHRLPQFRLPSPDSRRLAPASHRRELRDEALCRSASSHRHRSGNRLTVLLLTSITLLIINNIGTDLFTFLQFRTANSISTPNPTARILATSATAHSKIPTPNSISSWISTYFILLLILWNIQKYPKIYYPVRSIFCRMGRILWFMWEL